MSVVIQGNASQISTPLAASVTGTSSGTGGVIVISTAPTAHLFGNADLVTLASVGGTVEANGLWQITVLSSTSFSLNGSTWVNAWTSGGTATDNALTPPFQAPTDGDAFTANSLLPALQMLASRDAYLQLVSVALVAVVDALAGSPYTYFDGNGSVTVPAGISLATVFMCGGGGAGGNGSAGLAVNEEQALGGGGGEGAPLVCQTLAVTPGGTLNVVVGGGGSAGSGAGANGFAGTNSVVEDASTSAQVDARGGRPGFGAGGSAPYATSSLDVATPGGGNSILGASVLTCSQGYGFAFSLAHGHGGASFAGLLGAASSSSGDGGASDTGFNGGAAGTASMFVSSGLDVYWSGASGGGGGGGAFGNGGVGGNGGAPSASIGGSNGTTGAPPVANTGGGGGGGGAGGSCPSGQTPGAFAAGRAGASGFVLVKWG